jgi:hypothetical protein
MMVSDKTFIAQCTNDGDKMKEIRKTGQIKRQQMEYILQVPLEPAGTFVLCSSGILSL